MVKIHGICLVKNEEDVVAQTLSHASQFCHKIYVFDTGSTDGSWEKVQKINNSVVVPFRHEEVPFYVGLRAQVFNAIRSSCSIGDWIYILDADELLAEDPRKAIKIAEREGAEQINTLQYNFYFTDKDLEAYHAGNDSRENPITQRRRYYRFVNIEQRLFRVSEDLVWSESVDSLHPRGYMIPMRDKKLKKSSYKIPNRHYQYRDPEQIRLRLETRQAARSVNQNNFLHYKFLDEGVDWTKSIVPSEWLHYYKNNRQFEFTARERFKMFKERLGSRDFFRFDFLAGT
ncbi:glycosyltransferase family 2 protein [Altericista sp. CCNU0014]|uniref:glycosyltransferase family 2 protein n=1 Tax=Altericista sp. CCNU0014 TaxID=3082949 RepID=UPI00384C01DC